MAIYIKQVKWGLWVTYISFLKPRYADRFYEAYKNHIGLAHSEVILIKDLNNYISKYKLRASKEESKTNQAKEELKHGVFVKISDIPKETSKYEIRKTIPVKPKYIEYHDEGEAVVRFKNIKQKQKCLENLEASGKDKWSISIKKYSSFNYILTWFVVF